MKLTVFLFDYRCVYMCMHKCVCVTAMGHKKTKVCSPITPHEDWAAYRGQKCIPSCFRSSGVQDTGTAGHSF